MKFIARALGTLNPYLREDSNETLQNVRFLFDSEDLLDTTSSVDDVIITKREKKLMFGIMKIRISTPSLSDLVRRCVRACLCASSPGGGGLHKFLHISLPILFHTCRFLFDICSPSHVRYL